MDVFRKQLLTPLGTALVMAIVAPASLQAQVAAPAPAQNPQQQSSPQSVEHQPLQQPPPAGALPSAPAMQVVLPNAAPDTGAAGLSIVTAVQRALNLNPNLHLQQDTVDYYRGALKIQAGTFDPTLNINNNGGQTDTPLPTSSIQNAKLAGINTRADIVESATSTIGLSKVFRNGISISPSLNISRAQDNLTNQQGTINSQGSVLLTIPLLRNRGAAVVDAQERAARDEVEAQGLLLVQTASTTIAQTVSAYWNYIGALRSLNAYRESELRGQTLLDDVRAMIKADAIPRSQINLAIANVTTRTANRAAAEQSVVTAAQALATAIGVPAEQVLSIPAPSDPLPQLTSDAELPVTPQALMQYVHLALQRRGDYLGALAHINEYETLRIGARGQLLPQLDFTATAGYAGLEENGSLDKYFGSPFQNTVGPTLMGGINFSFPFGNHVARGEVQEADASVHQYRDSLDLTGNAIATAVVTAANGLNTSAVQLRAAHQSAESYRLALQGQRDLMRFGQSSLLDVVQSEDLYVNAQLSEISAQVAYANAIANFRYSTGTYVDPTNPNQTINADAFYRALTPAAAPVPAVPPPAATPQP